MRAITGAHGRVHNRLSCMVRATGEHATVQIRWCRMVRVRMLRAHYAHGAVQIHRCTCKGAVSMVRREVVAASQASLLPSGLHGVQRRQDARRAEHALECEDEDGEKKRMNGAWRLCYEDRAGATAGGGKTRTQSKPQLRAPFSSEGAVNSCAELEERARSAS